MWGSGVAATRMVVTPPSSASGSSSAPQAARARAATPAPEANRVRRETVVMGSSRGCVGGMGWDGASPGRAGSGGARAVVDRAGESVAEQMHEDHDEDQQDDGDDDDHGMIKGVAATDSR